MDYIISDKDIDTILVQGWDFRRLIKSKQPLKLVEEGNSIGISSNTDWFMCFKVIQKVNDK